MNDVEDDDPGLDAGRPGGVSGENGREYLGAYASVEEYLRSLLEHLLTEDGQWLLDHVDLAGVQRRLEGRVYRYFCDDEGRVFRERVPPAAPA